MNKVVLMGRLTRDPEVRYTNGDNSMAVARFSLAVDRRRSRNSNEGQTADFISCVAFGKQAEFTEKYLHKGTKILVTGRIQTGSYTNKDGQKVYTTDVVVEESEFAESRNASAPQEFGGYADQGRTAPAPSYNSFAPSQAPSQSSGMIDGFMNLPEGIDEELPFT